MKLTFYSVNILIGYSSSLAFYNLWLDDAIFFGIGVRQNYAVFVFCFENDKTDSVPISFQGSGENTKFIPTCIEKHCTGLVMLNAQQENCEY